MSLYVSVVVPTGSFLRACTPRRVAVMASRSGTVLTVVVVVVVVEGVGNGRAAPVVNTMTTVIRGVLTVTTARRVGTGVLEVTCDALPVVTWYEEFSIPCVPLKEVSFSACHGGEVYNDTVELVT